MCLGRRRGGGGGQNAGIGSFRQRLLQRRAHYGKLFRRHQRCIPSNSSRSSLRMWEASFSTRACKPATCNLRAAAREKKSRSKTCPVSKFLNQRLQFGKARRHRKQLFFFGGKMEGDLLFEHLLDFGLPCLQIDPSGLNGAIQAHTQRQAMLVLVGERNQVLVAKHVYPIFCAERPERNHSRAPAGDARHLERAREFDERNREVDSGAGGHRLGCFLDRRRRVSQSVRTLSHS